jgi:hypothetical protein
LCSESTARVVRAKPEIAKVVAEKAMTRPGSAEAAQILE